jgi:uncharacterized membrane protein YcaP (DUF421 family)
MNPEEIQLTDYMRILFGKDVPWTFLIEVVFRIFFIYILLIVSMRLMGKRMASTLTNSELAALVSLAAAVGVPMLDTTRGLMPAVVIAFIVVVAQHIISYYTFKNTEFESKVLGNISTLVEDGRIRIDMLAKNGISRDRLLAEFRNHGISNLGRVRRAYLEATGDFPKLLHEEPIPGLSILPLWDKEFRSEQQIAEGLYACASCGNIVDKHHLTDHRCEYCGHKEWTKAVFC